MRHFSPLSALPLCSLLFASPAFSQTKPVQPVPLESKSSARALVQQLLREGKIMSPRSAQRGMKGVAYSVFQGTTIEKFDVVVLGVMEGGQGGGDLVMIRVTSGPVVTRQSGIIEGMSGSPVYINGKLLGAIAIGFGFPKEPIGGVTPITQMIAGALPDETPTSASKAIAKPAAPTQKPLAPATVSNGQLAMGEYRPITPLTIRNRRIARLEITRDVSLPVLSGASGAATMRMFPATQMLLLSGVSEGGLNRWKSMLAPYGITPMLGGGSMGGSSLGGGNALGSSALTAQVFGAPSKKTGVSANLAPGAAIGVQIAAGDIDATGVGTVTYRIGNRVLAFGHPMFNLGAVSMPMTTAYIHDIFPAYDISFKLASPIKAVGELQQDTNFAIGGTVGRRAQTVPLRISVLDKTKKISRVYHDQLIKDPTFTPQIAQSIATDAVTSSFGLDSDRMVRVSFTMGLKNGPAIRRTNLVYAADQVAAGALGEMVDALSITQGNQFEKGNITSMDLQIEVLGARKTARIRRVYADKNRLKAGESAQISVVIEPTSEPDAQFTKRFTVSVPADAPSGVLRVAASSAGDIFAARARVGGAPPAPGNFRELITAYSQIGANNELLLQTSTPRRFLLIDRKRVTNPPPSWNRLVPGGTASSVSQFNETGTLRQPLDYVIAGLESISIPVESARESDKTRPDAPAAADNSSLSSSIISSNDSTTISSNSDGDDNDFVARLPKMRDLDAAPDFKARWRELAPLLMPKSAPQTMAPQESAVPISPAPDSSAPATLAPIALQIPSPKPAPIVPDEPQLAPSPKISTLPGGGLKTPAPVPTAAPTATPTPTPIPGVEAGAANIARPAGRFVQRTSAEFSRGQFDGTVVESDGTIRVGPRTQRLFSSAEPLAWSIASDGKGTTYLGTGNNARLLKIQNGVSKVIYEGPEVAVAALAVDSSGVLFAGVSPGGRVLRFNADGSHEVVLETGQTFVHALQFAPNGDLVVATGGENAKIYRRRISNSGERIPLLFDGPIIGGLFRKPLIAILPQKHARSLAVVGDSIYVGTAEDAVLYRIDGAGKVTALYQATSPATSSDDTPTIVLPSGAGGAPSGATLVLSGPPQQGGSSRASNEITALAASGDDVYFGTANNGTIYRWNAQSGVQELYKTPGRSVYALQMQGDSLYAATGDGGEVWRVSDLKGDVSAARVLDATQPQILALTSAGGKVFAATGNNAAAYEIGGAGQNRFTSNVFDAGQIVKFGALNAQSSGASFEFRSGNTLDPDATWSAWTSVPVGQSVTQTATATGARYAQYRATLGEGGTVSRVEIAFRTPNRAPRAAWVTPVGGDYFSAKKTLDWSATDPDSDTLRYKLEITGADGTQPIDLTTATASSQEIDTKKYPDGVYTAKVTASDAARNPIDPMTDSAVSRSFTIDNTAPTLSAPLISKADATWMLTFSASDALSPLAGAEWRLAATTAAPEAKPTATKSAALAPMKPNETKASDWQALAAGGGFFDSKSENVSARLDPQVSGIALKSGDAIEIRARDAAGNFVISKVVLP